MPDSFAIGVGLKGDEAIELHSILTCRNHAVEVLDGAEVDEQRACDFRKICHLFRGRGHYWRRPESNGCIGRLCGDDVVRDLANGTVSWICYTNAASHVPGGLEGRSA